MLKIIVLFLILGCQISFARILISGKVFDANNQIPYLAHVHISEYGESYYSPINSVQVDNNGRFNFEMDEGIYYGLYVTAAHHQGYYIPLITDKKDIKIDIRLKANEYFDSFDNVRIIGNWNGFRTRYAEEMAKQNDGTFTYKLETDSQNVSYQLVGIDKNGHTVNGTLFDNLTYDGGGDYISHITNKSGLVNIIFNPQHLLRNTNSFSQIKVYNDPTLIENGDIFQSFETFKTDYQDIFQRYINTNKTDEGFKFNYEEISAYLNEKMQHTDELVIRFAAINYISTFALGNTDNDFKTALKILPLEDPLWVSNGYSLVEIFEKTYGKKSTDEIINNHMDKIKSQGLRAKILLHYGLRAKEDGDIRTVTEIHHQLTENYSDLNSQRWFQWYVGQINPNTAIFKGKKVPQFQIKLLHSENIISDKTMLGKYYLIDFWAVWCAPCRAEMPNLHEIYKEFESKNFTILSLSFDPKIEDVDKYRKEQWNMPWLHAFVQNGSENELSKSFEVTGIPKPVLVGPTGKIIATDIELRGDNLKKTLDKFLNTTM